MKKLMKTQQYINQEYVDEKIEKINSGEHPTVDVVETENFLVVINGHHTLEAYEQLKKEPAINKLSTQEIRQLYGREAFVGDEKTQIDEDYFLYLEQ